MVATDLLVLSGTSRETLRKQATAQNKLQKELNRQAKELAKHEKKQKELARQSRPVFIRTVSHKPTYSIVSAKRLEGKAERSQNFKATPTFVSKSQIQSFKSQSRLKNALGWLLLFSDKKRVFSKIPKFNKTTKKMQQNFQFRLAFITLTLSDSQKHDDAYIKEHLLEPFLKWLNRYYQALYVWKAESQLNGRIHFHITIDTFIHWRHVRAKWNSILSKHGYCKVFQDGTNDKGNAATQIKAVLKESECARDISGYLSKKDMVTKDDIKKILENHPDYADQNTHCKWAPSLGTFNDVSGKWEMSMQVNKQDQKWYKRVIDGRLWGCSENLSGIVMSLDETYTEFEKEETIFFRSNPDVYNLGKKVITREKEYYAKMNEAERQVLCKTDEDIEQQYRFMNSVYIHKHLSLMKKGATLQRIIHEQKLKAVKNHQKFFTVETIE